jgi:hypothetical protein
VRLTSNRTMPTVTDPSPRATPDGPPRGTDDQDLRDLLTASVDTRPWATLGAALVLGFLLGRMLR